jgi:hypothetical protein
MSDRWLFAINFEPTGGRVEKSLTQNGWNEASGGAKTLGREKFSKLGIFRRNLLAR